MTYTEVIQSTIAHAHHCHLNLTRKFRNDLLSLIMRNDDVMPPKVHEEICALMEDLEDANLLIQENAMTFSEDHEVAPLPADPPDDPWGNSYGSPMYWVPPTDEEGGQDG